MRSLRCRFRRVSHRMQRRVERVVGNDCHKSRRLDDNHENQDLTKNGVSGGEKTETILGGGRPASIVNTRRKNGEWVKKRNR